MSDEAADREHPTAEKLSAYQANELPPEENDAIQEHVVSCSLCVERLLDLQRFLDFVPEPAQEGVADLATAAEWAKLRQRIRRETEKERVFASARGGYSLAAALLVVSAGLTVWNLSLWRESHRPQALYTIQTLEAKESFRGGVEPAEPVSLPGQITLNLPTERPDPVYRIELFPEGSPQAEASLELLPQGSELRLYLPEKSLPPGNYSLRVRGLRGGKPSSRAWTYELTIAPQRR